jgi:chromosome segregation ATPase
MPEEWLTYREIGARLGLNVEAVRTRVRRAGWRTQAGNDGRARVLVPDRVFVEPVVDPVSEDADRVNRTGDLPGLVTLLTAAEARISRLEKQLEAEHDRVNEARSEADRLRGEVTDLTARADRAEQTSTAADAARQEAEQAADALREQVDALRAGQDLMMDMHAQALAAAQDRLERLREAAEGLRQAEQDRRARGLLARLRAAVRGE